MGCQTTVLCLFGIIAAVKSIEVNLTNTWKTDIGWEITCSWKLPSDDSLQSVRLYQNEQQFIVFRPEMYGNFHDVYRRPEDLKTINCALSENPLIGTCTITMDLLQPQRGPFTIACEVSGERPRFRLKKETITIDPLVQPTDAIIAVSSRNVNLGLVSLNCTASGMPSPNLTWKIGDQKIPHDFAGGAWNATSKLWYTWSVLSYRKSNEHVAVCTPEINAAGKTLKGKPAVYNSALDLNTVTSIEVDLTHAWKTNIGWEITCSWQLPPDDSLQSVRLYNNEQQFMIFRPEAYGNTQNLVYRRPQDLMTINCAKSENPLIGTCKVTMELFQPQREPFTVACEVSGERPRFRIEKKTINIDNLMQPTDAIVEVISRNVDSGRMLLNCTASGMPSPRLTWTIGDQQIPHDFAGAAWNVTSKLWYVWSVLSYTTTSEHAAICTPEINLAGKTYKGHSAEYNAASDVKSVLTKLIIIVASLLLLR